MQILATTLLFTATAIAEVLGCYLPYLWLRQGRSIWLLLPAGLSLIVFVWLLTLHPAAAGRTYAAYGGVYVSAALVWLWLGRGNQAEWLGRSWSAALPRRHGSHHLGGASLISLRRQERQPNGKNSRCQRASTTE